MAIIVPKPAVFRVTEKIVSIRVSAFRVYVTLGVDVEIIMVRFEISKVEIKKVGICFSALY